MLIDRRWRVVQRRALQFRLQANRVNARSRAGIVPGQDRVEDSRGGSGRRVAFEITWQPGRAAYYRLSLARLSRSKTDVTMRAKTSKLLSGSALCVMGRECAFVGSTDLVPARELAASSRTASAQVPDGMADSNASRPDSAYGRVIAGRQRSAWSAFKNGRWTGSPEPWSNHANRAAGETSLNVL